MSSVSYPEIEESEDFYPCSLGVGEGVLGTWPKKKGTENDVVLRQQHQQHIHLLNQELWNEVR